MGGTVSNTRGQPAEKEVRWTLASTEKALKHGSRSTDSEGQRHESWGCSAGRESLPSMHKALGSIAVPQLRKNKIQGENWKDDQRHKLE